METAIQYCFLITGIVIFYLGFKTGRNTRYQDQNVPPPPDPITGRYPETKKSLIENLTQMVARKKMEDEQKKAKTGVIGPLDEPDFTKRG